MKSFLKYTLATIVGLLVAGLLGMLILMGIFSAIVSMSDKPMVVKDKSLLMLKLEGPIVERSERNPFGNFSPFGMSKTNIGLDDILKSIRNAKDDSKIRGIYLNPSMVTAGLATVEEIRNAILDFKESGKFVYAYGENLTQKTYYLVSVADKVVLNPKGMVEFQGLSARYDFFKNTFEKMGVEIQVIKHGKFKAAVEPFILEKMSPENREQVGTYLNSLWGQMVSAIALSRNISEARVNELADEVMTLRSADLLVTNGLIDTLMYKDEVLNELKEMTKIRESSDLRVVSVGDYARVPVKTDGKGLARDKIAIIYAIGAIDDPFSWLSGSGIDSEEISRTIRIARRDSTIKAIVLRINSPGGSAYGSEVIWREVQLASETKPVIASIGDVAASGGYYIATAADTILANKTAITGSIGVFTAIPNTRGLVYGKLGVNRDHVNTNRHSNLLELNRPLTGFETSLLQQNVENTYDTFLDRVSAGRNMSREKVDNVGQGRVWSAGNALDLGLIDMFGGIDDAVKLAAEMSGLKRYRVVQLPKLKDPFEMLIQELSGRPSTWFRNGSLGEYGKIVEELGKMTGNNIIQARLPYGISIE